MPTANLDEGRGKADFKEIFGTSSLAPGDSIDTGLSTVKAANLTVEETSGTVIASVDSTSDGTVTVQHNATGGGSETVHYDVIGY